MKIETLQLINFRNYQNLDIQFSDGVNIFLGENAQGKTNLIEAIYILGFAHSHRTNDDKTLINWNSSQAKITGIIHRDSGLIPLEVEVSNSGKKVMVNHLISPRLSDYVGNFQVIMFAPEDLEIVKGSPTYRRKFMDREFGQMSSNYMYQILEYRKILKDRNAYLKQLQMHQNDDLVYLDVLTEQLIDAGSKIIVDRYRFVKKLEKFAELIHGQITNEMEKLQLEYQSSINDGDEIQVANQLRKSFDNNQNREIFQGTTLIGPHRDDLIFILNGQDVYEFGSQGQQRTTALSIKLAEIDLLKELTGEYPVLLLDDVLSELDSNRQTQLLKAIENKVQTFITTPSISDVVRTLIKQPEIFSVENGKVKQGAENE
jgi:DNA replication and repair protein RecF